MKILLDKGTPELVDKFLARIDNENIEVEIVDYKYPVTAEERWRELVLASEGHRLYTDAPHKDSPLYVSSLPKNSSAVVLALVDAEFSLSSLNYYRSFGITYIGRTTLSPRNILLVDHKKADLRHDVHLSDEIRDFLTAAPEGWWNTLGIVSSGNIEKLEEFMNEHIDSVPLAYTTGAMSKLKFFGLDYVHINTPNPSREYGIQVRERANRLFEQPV